jgi:hypothetical protein
VVFGFHCTDFHISLRFTVHIHLDGWETIARHSRKLQEEEEVVAVLLVVGVVEMMVRWGMGERGCGASSSLKARPLTRSTQRLPGAMTSRAADNETAAAAAKFCAAASAAAGKHPSSAAHTPTRSSLARIAQTLSRCIAASF